MRVHHSPFAELGTIAAGAPQPALEDAPKTSFADALAKTSTTPNGAAPAPAPAETERQRDDRLPKGPKGETTRAVKDHPAYVEIMSGPRNGMFINVTHNERRGEAFVLVRKHDRDLHIYGSGKDRRVIISWHKDQPAHRDDHKAAPAKDAAPPTGGASAPA